jgi:hypothetical protein
MDQFDIGSSANLLRELCVIRFASEKNAVV